MRGVRIMSMPVMCASLNYAIARASRRLSAALPGATLYVVQVDLIMDNGGGPREWWVVAADGWRAFRATLGGRWPAPVAYAEVHAEVLMVLRKPVESPPEIPRHVFAVGQVAPLHG